MQVPVCLQRRMPQEPLDPHPRWRARTQLPVHRPTEVLAAHRPGCARPQPPPGSALTIETNRSVQLSDLEKGPQRRLQCITGALLMAAIPSLGQQMTGTPGSPDATTTIDGRYIPAPPQPFQGQIGLNALQSKAAW